MTDHHEAILTLTGVNENSLPPPDRAILFLELGKRLRHTGDVEAASLIHSKIDNILDDKSIPFTDRCLECP